ncbi:uncharacterized protein HKW66_Vig0246260 [Vigna angularis]|uniref:Aminotransferase-like plant mobile domain-containing protein n=1 Tax=Phaseolus angularis TaxID=3914 RepID=A0A8T0KC42_PHAAN|nr:uncharacterized protein HKW66_Vig0246260 [Vigna angularis]
MFEIVDNLSGLGNYCWGSLVYRYLVRSLCKASDALKKGKGTHNIYVNGCVYMLQVWFCENFSPPKNRIEKFPRILHWMNINLGDNFVKGVMEMDVVHHDVDVGASMKDKKDDQQRPKMKDDQPTPKKLQKRKRRESFM